MSAEIAARCVTETARWVPTLSLDEPINAMPERWWRLLFATGWLCSATGEMLEETRAAAARPAPPAPVRIAEPD